MLPRSRLLLTLNQNVSNVLETPDQSVFLRLVRWRKRRWAPINPTKLFYVREPTPIDPEEWKELRDRYGRYTRRVSAIRAYWMKEMKADSAAKKKAMQLAYQTEDTWDKRMEENDRWNQETAKLREAHQLMLEQQREEEHLERMVKLEERKQQETEEARTLLQRVQEEAKHFVKLEDLEVEIEKALNTPVNFNFVIDEDGNRYLEQADGRLIQEESGKHVMDPDSRGARETKAA